MPTVLKAFGIRLYFSSSDRDEPIHVHAETGSGRAKFWIRGRSATLVFATKGMKKTDIADAKELSEDNIQLIVEKWHAFFND